MALCQCHKAIKNDSFVLYLCNSGRAITALLYTVREELLNSEWNNGILRIVIGFITQATEQTHINLNETMH